MPDTERGDFPNTPCSDCGKIGGVYIRHWGPLVPQGKVGYFDQDCLMKRRDDSNLGRPVRPLGVQSEFPLEE